MKGRRGPRGSDSHIPQSPVYQGHTPQPPPSSSSSSITTTTTAAATFPPLHNASVHQSPTLPKCQGRDLGDSANSTLRLVGRGHKQRAERERRERDVEGEGGRERWRQRVNGTVCKTHLNWRLFCNVLFFLGICEGEGQESKEVRLFPKVLNSGINRGGETQ